MDIFEQINSDFLQAYKNKEEAAVSTLRLLLAALKNEKINKKADLEDQDVLKILKSEIKKRKEAIEEYEKAGRQELADKEKAELPILEKYMPAQLSEDQIRLKVQEIVKASAETNIGKLMGKAMAELKGEADGNLVKKIVEEELNC